jgi:hypothetical protein
MPTPEERRELRRIKRKLVQAQYKVNLPKKTPVKKDNMGPIHLLMTVTFFIGLFLITNYATVTVISTWSITKIFAGILAISLLIPIKWYRKKLTINIYEFFLLGLLGYAPFLTGIYFATNYFTRGNEHVETYKIEQVEMHTFFSDLILENDTLNEYALLTCFDSRDSGLYKGRTKAKYTFEDGGLGLKILVDKRAIP